MKDHRKAWRISGSAALEAVARTYAAEQGIDLSKVVNAAVRDFLGRRGIELPPPLVPAKRGPKPKRDRGIAYGRPPRGRPRTKTVEDDEPR